MPTETLVAATRNCAPPLTPKLAPWMSELLQSPSLIHKLVEENGSPLHIVVASEFRRNIEDLMSPFKKHGLSGGLFFARKANKLPWFVEEAKEQGIGVDTASHQELKETLELRVSPEKIIVTAIGKSRELITEAIKNKCLLVIDNFDELQLVRWVSQSLGVRARIGIRFSGFKVKGLKVFSRFGIPIDDLNFLLTEICKENQDQWLQIELLHAHLDRYDIEERACAARQLIEIADCLGKVGHKISALDLGGGILVRYLKEETEWNAFLKHITDSVLGIAPSCTYLNDGLGFYKAGDAVLGKADLYPAWNDVSKERFIASILDSENDAGISLYKELANRQLKLFFEPGRALLDNVGLTLSSVSFRKRDTDQNLLIGTAMNRTNLRPFRAEFCLDPILISKQAQQKATEGAFLVGNLCSESDLIFRRRLSLNYLPQPGDTLCFINTAGYLAHHLEIGTHGGPLPINLLLDEQTFEILDRR